MMPTRTPGNGNGQAIERVIRHNEAARRRFAEELDELLAAIREATEAARRAGAPPPPEDCEWEARDG